MNILTAIFLASMAFAASVAFIYAAYIDKFSEFFVNRSAEFRVLDDKVAIKEVVVFNKTIRTDHKASHGLRQPGESGVLSPDGSITSQEKEFKWVRDSDPDQNVMLFRNLLFKGNEVYRVDAWTLGEKLGEFERAAMESVQSIYYANDENILMIADKEKPLISSPNLWQINKATLEATLISDSPHPYFDRPVMSFTFGNTPWSDVNVYFTGVVRYGWSGDSSRPKASVVRIYSELFPDGKDIVEFSFKAGTVVDIRQADVLGNSNDLIITTDPSLPGSANVPAVPVRKWRVSLR